MFALSQDITTLGVVLSSMLTNVVEFCVSICIDNVTGRLYGYVDVTGSIWKRHGI